MGFADPVAGDGKGGWSDQGPDNDAHNFKWRSPATFANVPFAVIDPAKNNGRSVLTMRATNFPAGLEEAEIPLPPVPSATIFICCTPSATTSPAPSGAWR